MIRAISESMNIDECVPREKAINALVTRMQEVGSRDQAGLPTTVLSLRWVEESSPSFVGFWRIYARPANTSTQQIAGPR